MLSKMKHQDHTFQLTCDEGWTRVLNRWTGTEIRSNSLRKVRRKSKISRYAVDGSRNTINKFLRIRCRIDFKIGQTKIHLTVSKWLRFPIISIRLSSTTLSVCFIPKRSRFVRFLEDPFARLRHRKLSMLWSGSKIVRLHSNCIENYLAFVLQILEPLILFTTERLLIHPIRSRDRGVTASKSGHHPPPTLWKLEAKCPLLDADA